MNDKKKDEWYYLNKDRKQKARIEALLYFIISLIIMFFTIWIMYEVIL